MENSYQKMREEIIQMQRWFDLLDEQTKKDTDVIHAVNKLDQTRSALEVLWMKTSETLT